MRIIMLTGDIDSGKTRYLSGIVSALRGRGVSVGGILCPGVYADGLKTGYDAVDIETGERVPLVSVTPFAEGFSYSRFFFSAEGYRFASSALRRFPYPDCLIVDEVGPVELAGMGYAEDLCFLVSRYSGILILAVRKPLCGAVREAFGLYGFPLEIRNAGDDSAEFLLEAR
jgi:nucleoside-triphosphatase THEP1